MVVKRFVLSKQTIPKKIFTFALLKDTMEKEKEYSREEIRKEFQLDRMIVFSDAVFAIVITLMAIEIRVPELARNSGSEIITHELFKLIPPIISYAISFFFIGHIWYQHLHLFSLLKDYNKGIVIRNLIMLFFVGLFPFSAALVIKLSNGFAIPFIIYCSIILASKSAQLVLQHYILFKRPELRINTSIKDDLIKFKKSRLGIILLLIVFTLVIITFQAISDPEDKQFAYVWFLLFPIVLRILRRRIK